jgi:hypothetical protein
MDINKFNKIIYQYIYILYFKNITVKWKYLFSILLNYIKEKVKNKINL